MITYVVAPDTRLLSDTFRAVMVRAAAFTPIVVGPLTAFADDTCVVPSHRNSTS